MSENRKIAKNSAILYIRLIIVTVCGLFSSRLVLQSLGASDFGLYNVVGGIVVMIGVLNTAMISTSFRYIAFEMGKGDVQGVNRIFNISIVLHACLALIVVVLAETVGIYYIHHYLNVPVDRNADAVFVFRLSVLATVFSIFSVPYQALITAREEFSVRSVIEVISAFLRLATAVSLLYYGANVLRFYAVLATVVIALTSIQYIAYCHWKYSSTVSWKFQTETGRYREMVAFAGWIMLGAATCIGRVQGAALIINIFFGTILNAAFGIANQINQLVLTFTQNLGQAAIPQITKSYSSGNTDRTMQLVCYMTKYSFFLMLLPALPIFLETDFLLHLWLKDVPKHTALFCQLMILGVLIDCLIAAIPAAIQATGNIKYFQIITNAISLAGLPVAWVLYRFGYAAHSILVVYIVTALINVGVCQVLLKKLIDFDIKRFFKTSYVKIFYVVACVSPLFAIKNLFEESLLRFIFMSLTALVWFVVAVYVVGVEEKERAAAKIGLVHIWSKVSQRGTK